MIGETRSNPLRAIRRSAASGLVCLSQRRQWYALDGDAPEGETVPTPTTPAGKTGGESGANLIPQEDANRLIGNARKEGRQSATNDLLKELGLEKVDDLKALVTDAVKRKEAEMSATDKADAARTKAEAERDTLKQQLETERLERVKDKRDTAIENAATSAHAHKPKAAIRWAQDEAPDDLAKCVNTDSTVNTAEVGKLIEAWKKAEPFQFQSGGAGSPSNFGGRVVTPDAAKALGSKSMFNL